MTAVLEELAVLFVLCAVDQADMLVDVWQQVLLAVPSEFVVPLKILVKTRFKGDAKAVAVADIILRKQGPTIYQ